MLGVGLVMAREPFFDWPRRLTDITRSLVTEVARDQMHAENSVAAGVQGALEPPCAVHRSCSIILTALSLRCLIFALWPMIGTSSFRWA